MPWDHEGEPPATPGGETTGAHQRSSSLVWKCQLQVGIPKVLPPLHQRLTVFWCQLCDEPPQCGMWSRSRQMKQKYSFPGKREASHCNRGKEDPVLPNPAAELLRASRRAGCHDQRSFLGRCGCWTHSRTGLPGNPESHRQLWPCVHFHPIDLSGLNHVGLHFPLYRTMQTTMSTGTSRWSDQG